MKKSYKKSKSTTTRPITFGIGDYVKFKQGKKLIVKITDMNYKKQGIHFLGFREYKVEPIKTRNNFLELGIWFNESYLEKASKEEVTCLLI